MEWDGVHVENPDRVSKVSLAHDESKVPSVDRYNIPLEKRA